MKAKKQSKEEIAARKEGREEGYTVGFQNGFNEAALRMARAVGLLREDAPTPEEVAPVTPPAGEPVEPPGPLCADCGHDKKEHEPHSAKGCFVTGGCSCPGFTEKRVWKIGRLKVRS